MLYYPVGGLSETEGQEVLAAAEALGMKVNYMTGGFEMFDREHPPAISVYSPRYAEEVSKRVEAGLAPMKAIRRIYSVFPFQDEPFHASPGAFDYSSDAKAEFNRRYGYPDAGQPGFRAERPEAMAGSAELPVRDLPGWLAPGLSDREGIRPAAPGSSSRTTATARLARG